VSRYNVILIVQAADGRKDIQAQIISILKISE